MENLSEQSAEGSLRNQIVACGKSLRQSGFVAGSEGNISLRASEERILITPAGARKGELDPSDIVVITPSGKLVPGDSPLRPSSEYGMHLTAYSARPDIGACIHSHAPYAASYAVAGIEPEIDVMPEVPAFVGRIVLTEYATPGTEALGKSLLPFLADCNAFLLKNHGLLTIGKTLAEALNRHEIVEKYLKILTLARTLGNVDHLDSAEMEHFLKTVSD